MAMQTDDAREPALGMIDMEEFSRLELRIARVLTAEEVAGADRLLRLQLDVGQEGERTVLAGIRQHYKPEELEGRLLVLVANLQPRKMRFGISEGMVLAAGDKDAVRLLSPDAAIAPGTRVH